MDKKTSILTAAVTALTLGFGAMTCLYLTERNKHYAAQHQLKDAEYELKDTKHELEVANIKGKALVDAMFNNMVKNSINGER